MISCIYSFSKSLLVGWYLIILKWPYQRSIFMFPYVYSFSCNLCILPQWGSFLILWSKVKLTYIWKHIKFWIWKWVVCVKFSDGKLQLPRKYGLCFTYCMILFISRNLTRSSFSMLSKFIHFIFYAVSCWYATFF